MVGLAFFGTDAFDGGGGGAGNAGAVTPVYLGNPTLKNDKKLGEKILDINAFGIPAFGTTGPTQPANYLRFPSRSNFDVSFFKNFVISENKKFQFRTGFFNIFNQAYPTRIDTGNPNASDINLQLNTTCNRRTTTPTPNGSGASWIRASAPNWRVLIHARYHCELRQDHQQARSPCR